MKIIIAMIALLILSNICTAQKDTILKWIPTFPQKTITQDDEDGAILDSIPFKNNYIKDQLHIYSVSDTTGAVYISNYKADSVIYDTVRTIMLTCDTFHYYQDQLTYWRIGYEVRSVSYQFTDISVDPNHMNPDGTTTLVGMIPVYKQMPYYSHIKYLDADKQELSKNIFVWMSKTLNHD